MEVTEDMHTVQCLRVQNAHIHKNKRDSNIVFSTYGAYVFFFCIDAHVEPHKKQLHVTLAYHFQPSHLPVLEKLAKNVDASSGCDWLAVLYSRDLRFANHEVDSLIIIILSHDLPQCLMLMIINNLPTVDTAGHVPVCASE